MNSIKTVADVQVADTATLIEFYNHHNAEKPVKKFADRKTAIARCEKLAHNLGLPEVAKVDSEGDEQAESNIKMPAANSGWGNLLGTPSPSIEVSEVTDEVIADEEEEAVVASQPSMLNLLLNGQTESQKVANEANKSRATHVVDGKKVDPNAKPEVEKDTGGRASNSAGVAASWARPDVFAARLKRDGVSVTINGATAEYTSTREAFRAYRLPSSKHIRFRMKLKAAGEAVFEWEGKTYLFKIVPAKGN